MAEHVTRNTVSAAKYCPTCKEFTQHNCSGGRIGSCQECIKRLDNTPKVEPPARQSGLFDVPTSPRPDVEQVKESKSMKITIESTDLFTRVDGKLCRVWRSVTEKGVPCDVAIPLLRVKREADQAQFEAELKALPAPEESRVVDMRYVW